MIEFERSAPTEGEDIGGRDPSPTPSPSSHWAVRPEGLELFDALPWKPVPSAYDWYGEVDPDGLADGSEPLGGGAAPVTPAARERAGWPLDGARPPAEGR